MQQPFAIGRSACVLGAFDLGRYWEGLMRGRREVIKVGHMIEGAVAKLGQGRKAQPQDISCPCSGVLKLSRISG